MAFSAYHDPDRRNKIIDSSGYFSTCKRLLIANLLWKKHGRSSSMENQIGKEKFNNHGFGFFSLSKFQSMTQNGEPKKSLGVKSFKWNFSVC